MRKRLFKSPWFLIPFGVAALGFLTLSAGGIYYVAAGDQVCLNCHEIREAHTAWLSSSHREVQCKACHGSVFTTDFGFHKGIWQEFVTHVQGRAPERVQIKVKDIDRLVNGCASCHPYETKAWREGPHNATYADIFLNAEHNKTRLIDDTCFRCHGMHFAKGIADTVSPLDTIGPWQLLDERVKDVAAIPCMACHQIHREGVPADPGTAVAAGAGNRKKFKPALAFFDRRSRVSYAAEEMPVPEMTQDGAPIALDKDRRQALCYQCHAPQSNFHAGTNDDRTCMGVHQGIGCIACHKPHSEETRSSCADCHPRDSNCGMDVLTMDTTFLSKDSKHNIHFVKCTDCHTNGVPERKAKPAEL